MDIPQGSIDETSVPETLRSAYRTLIGQLLWLALETRADVASATSILAQRTITAVIGDCGELNKVGRCALSRENYGFSMKRNVISLFTATILS